jgi:hypothetical protein
MFNEPHATSGSKVMVDFLIELVSLSCYLHILNWSKKMKITTIALKINAYFAMFARHHHCKGGAPPGGASAFEPFETAILTGFVRIVGVES